MEKSPHHLYNDSNLQLILNFKNAYVHKLDVIVIGLVRHPLSVIYSAWKRWKYLPHGFQKEWLTSYKNLIAWKKKLGIVIIKYEDLVTGQKNILDFIGEPNQKNKFKFNTSSLEKWKNNKLFGFKISPEVKYIAQKYGYKNFEVRQSIEWPLNYAKYGLLSEVKSVMKILRENLLNFNRN